MIVYSNNGKNLTKKQIEKLNSFDNCFERYDWALKNLTIKVTNCNTI